MVFDEWLVHRKINWTNWHRAQWTWNQLLEESLWTNSEVDMHLLINALSIIRTATLGESCCNHSWLLTEIQAGTIAPQKQNSTTDSSNLLWAITVCTTFLLPFIKETQCKMKGESLTACWVSPRVFLMVFSLTWASYCKGKLSVGIVVMNSHWSRPFMGYSQIDKNVKSR